MQVRVNGRHGQLGRPGCQLTACGRPLYQILHGHYDIQLNATFCIIDNSRTRDHAYKLLKPHCTTDTTKYFFSLTVLLVPGTTCQ